MSYTYLFSLAVILLSTKLLSMATGRLQLPQVVGSLLAGLIFGPAVLGVIQPSEFLSQLSELGVIVIMFTAGMGTSLKDLRSTGPTGFMVALCGVLVPLFMVPVFCLCSSRAPKPSTTSLWAPCSPPPV